MEDPYEHEDPMVGYTPCNVPGRGCDAATFDDCFADGCVCEDNCARCLDICEYTVILH